QVQSGSVPRRSTAVPGALGSVPGTAQLSQHSTAVPGAPGSVPRRSTAVPGALGSVPGTAQLSQHSTAVPTPGLSLSAVLSTQPQLPPSPALPPQSRPPQPPALLALPAALATQQQQQQQQQQQKLRLQRIQMERERIRMRQEELLRQEAALCRQLPMDSENMVAVQTAVNSPAMTQDMRPITNNGSDPFLSSGPYHSREQSTDSGLGLGCYSIPTTPEDFLGNVDEMDTGRTLGLSLKYSPANDFVYD
uniref:WW domain containing transcription regulator 1 n=1 Tax=Ficedula albicollis TaxID=59894 RepID=A0A803W0J7_FICAL